MNKLAFSLLIALGVGYSIWIIFDSLDNRSQFQKETRVSSQQLDNMLDAANKSLPPKKEAKEMLETGIKVVDKSEIEDIVRSDTLPGELGYQAFINNKPSSLKELPPPGKLDLDENKNLVINHKVKFLFEHYLSALGEESIENIVIRIKHDLKNQLEKPQFDTSLVILESYLQYRNELGQIQNDFAILSENSGTSVSTVRQLYQASLEARASYFSETEIAGLFEEEDLQFEYLLTKAEIKADPQLSNHEKQQALKEHSENAPESIIALEKNETELEALLTIEKNILNNSYSEVDSHEIRVREMGEDRAQRFTNLDLKRREWNKRVAMYRTELNLNTQPSSLDKEIVAEIRQRYFQGPELIRIAAIDKIDLGL